MASLAANLKIVERELRLRGNRCALCGKKATVDTIAWHHIAVRRDERGRAVRRTCGCLVVDKAEGHEIANLKYGASDKLIAELKKCIPMCPDTCHLQVCHGH